MTQTVEQQPKFEVLEVLNAIEPWAEFFLADGSKLKVRLIITEVRKAVGVKNPDGSPLLQIDWQIIQRLSGAPTC